MTVSYVQQVAAIHQRLNDLGVTCNDHGFADRLYRVLDRLQLRAEGEPDCADLVGKINELCDREGIRSGSPDERVEALAAKACAVHAVRAELTDVRYVLADAGDFVGTLAERTRALMQERDGLRKQLTEARADLEAERAQLAAKATKPVATERVNLALAVIDEGLQDDAPEFALALAVLREAFA